MLIQETGKSKNNEFVKKAIEKGVDLPEVELPKKEKVLVEKDLMTGVIKEVGKEIPYNVLESSKYNLDDILEMKIPKSLDEVELSKHDIKVQLKDKLGNKISDDDVLVFMDLVKRYQSGDTKNMYEVLPEKAKGSITKEFLTNNIPISKAALNAATEALISTIITDCSIDNFTVELQNAIDSAIDNGAAEEASKLMFKTMKENEAKYKKASEELRKNGYTDKADILDDIISATDDAYNFTSLLNALKNHKIKIKKYDIEKHDRIFRDFDAKYTKSPYKIRNISVIPVILNRNLPKENDITTETIIAFTIAICKLCMNYTPNNPGQHSFMYNTIQAMVYTDITQHSEDLDILEFRDRVVTKILECMDILNKEYKVW